MWSSKCSKATMRPYLRTKLLYSYWIFIWFTHPYFYIAEATLFLTYNTICIVCAKHEKTQICSDFDKLSRVIDMQSFISIHLVCNTRPRFCDFCLSDGTWKHSYMCELRLTEIAMWTITGLLHGFLLLIVAAFGDPTTPHNWQISVICAGDCTCDDVLLY